MFTPLLCRAKEKKAISPVMKLKSPFDCGGASLESGPPPRHCESRNSGVTAGSGGALAQTGLAQTDAGQTGAAKIGAAQPRVAVPGFWDPRRRPERPDLSRIQSIRFLTEIDYPPFDYAGPDGNPAGFNVDLARLLCDEIKASCTIQARRFDTLLDALNDNRGDAVIASIV